MQGCEEAEKNLREMRAPRHEHDTASSSGRKQEDVHKVTSARTLKKTSGGISQCYCCGKPGHIITDRKLCVLNCLECGKKGHWPMCAEALEPHRKGK